MQKTQIFVIIVAILSVGAIYSLPKVLVSDKEQVLAPATSAGTKPNTADTHSTNLSEVQVANITKLRNGYLNSVDVEKKITFADSLAVVFKQASQFDSAATYLEAVAALSPTVESWIKAGNGYYDAFNFATDAQKAGKMGEKAREYFQKVLEKDPGQLDVKANLAMTYITSANPMQGIALLREVIEKDPQNQLALFNLGALSMQSGQYDKAIERFKQVLAINPGNAQAQFYLGISYAESGHKEEARELLQQVKLTNSDPVVQSTVDEYLKKIK
jgi:tetratricopeptide (TPR) repeat protein